MAGTSRRGPAAPVAAPIATLIAALRLPALVAALIVALRFPVVLGGGCAWAHRLRWWPS